MPLRFHRHPHAEALSRWAAAEVRAALRAKPDLVLCAATGDTPTRTYAHLAAHARAHPEAFARLVLVGLDEWLGLAPLAPPTCRAYLHRHLAAPLGLPPARVVAFDSAAPDPAAEARRMRHWLDAHGPIDLAVLGLGTNGHLGFLEPAAVLPPRPHVAVLTPETRRHAMVCALAAPPTHGLTLGIGDLLAAHRVLLLVSGPHKRAALARLRRGPVTPRFPATLLHDHPDAVCVFDEAAAM